MTFNEFEVRTSQKINHVKSGEMFSKSNQITVNKIFAWCMNIIKSIRIADANGERMAGMQYDDEMNFVVISCSSRKNS